MFNRISVLSLALLVTVVSVASSVLSQEIKPGSVSSLISQLASPGRKEQLEQQGNRDGYEAGRTGLDANPKTGITALGLTDPAEQKFYSDAYSSGYLQARLNLGNGGSPTISPTIAPTATITPTTTPTTTPTNSSPHTDNHSNNSDRTHTDNHSRSDYFR